MATKTHDHRVNARVDDATQERLNDLILTTGGSVSHVVREAIAVYHAQVRKERPAPKRLLAMVGKGRSRDGRTDVASNYKQVVTEIIEEKYRLSHPRKASRKP
jgi:Ribbon-helix-helix protein, copG family